MLFTKVYYELSGFPDYRTPELKVACRELLTTWAAGAGTVDEMEIIFHQVTPPSELSCDVVIEFEFSFGAAVELLNEQADGLEDMFIDIFPGVSFKILLKRVECGSVYRGHSAGADDKLMVDAKERVLEQLYHLEQGRLTARSGKPTSEGKANAD